MRRVSRALTRRQVLGMLGACPLGTLRAHPAASTNWPIAAPSTTLRTQASAATSRRPIIRTLLGDIEPRALGDGAVLFHEHLSARWGRATHFSDDHGLIAEEVKASRADGIACIVDAGHPDIGRSIRALERIASESGVPIVASGGYYTQRLFPADIVQKSVDTLADELVNDARAERHGALGEIGQEGEMTADERRVFQAVAKAHVRTGLPIFTHNAYMGTRAPRVGAEAALRQLDLLESAGVNPRRVALGHMCCLHEPDASMAREAARRGAFIGFDRVTMEAFVPDADKVTMIVKLIEAGYQDRILLSSDFFQERALKKHGGAGFAQTVTVFAPKLRAAGVSDAIVRQILADNPKRFLAFDPL